jgi:hypothetical protein
MLGVFLAKRLCRTNPAAGRFLAELADTKNGCQEVALRGLSCKDIDLWERIDKRIDQEIRSQAFLGKREGARDSVKSALPLKELMIFKSPSNLVSGAIGGVAGAAVAALLIITLGTSSPRELSSYTAANSTYRAPKILSANDQQLQNIAPRLVRTTPKSRASSDQRLIRAPNGGWQLVVPSESGRGPQRLRVVRRLGILEGSLLEASRSRRGTNTVVLLVPRAQ